MTLSTQHLTLLDQRLANQRKTVAIGYLYYVFLGAFGAHRFYLGKKGSALAQLELLVLGLLTRSGWEGIILLTIWAIWMLYDLIALPSLIHEDNLVRREVMLTRLMR